MNQLTKAAKYDARNLTKLKLLLQDVLSKKKNRCGSTFKCQRCQSAKFLMCYSFSPTMNILKLVTQHAYISKENLAGMFARFSLVLPEPI